MTKKNIGIFFSEKNTVHEISNVDDFNLEKFIKPIEAFARVTYKSVYVINYHTKGFDYVSDNPLLLCGKTPKEVQRMGYTFYFNHVPEDDLELLLKINTIGFDFFEQQPVDSRLDFSISYDFHLINADDNTFLVNHKLTPILLNEQGKIVKALCLVSLSNEAASGNIKIMNERTNEVYIYNEENNFWKKEIKIELKPREIEILKLSARGYGLEEMGEKLFISPNTVKFHRKKIFEKLKVHSIADALAFATSNKLL